MPALKGIAGWWGREEAAETSRWGGLPARGGPGRRRVWILRVLVGTRALVRVFLGGI